MLTFVPKCSYVNIILIWTINTLWWRYWTKKEHPRVILRLQISIVIPLTTILSYTHTSTHYNDVIKSAMASQITSLTIVYSTVCSRRRSQKLAKFCITGFCEENSPVTGEFPAQRASNAENVSIWWRHHAHTTSIPIHHIAQIYRRHTFLSRTVISISRQKSMGFWLSARRKSKSPWTAKKPSAYWSNMPNIFSGTWI